MTKKIGVQRLRWLGHLARMNDDNVAKRAFERNPEGRNPKLGVGLSWRTAAWNRAVWRGLIH